MTTPYATMDRMEPTYDVVWPKSPRGMKSHALADRLDTLDRKRVAFLWDDLFRGDEIFPGLEVELTRRFPTVEIVGYDVFGNTHGTDEKEMVAGLAEGLTRRQIDAVISGVGC